MAGKRLVLVLALACLLAVNAAESGSFIKWLDGKVSAKTQSAYEEIETTSTCLQQIAHRNCRYFDAAHNSHFTEVKVACCKSADEGDKYSSNLPDLFAEIKSIGLCTFEEHYFADGPVAYKTSDCTKVGKFSVTCELHEDSNKCGSPLCEGLHLKAEGEILHYDNVAFIGDLVNPTEDDDCKARSLTEATKKTTPAKLQYSKSDGEEEINFKVGPGDIYAGVFHVVSRHHKMSYKNGEFQMVKHTGAAVDYNGAKTPPEKCFVAKDAAIALDFFKSGDYY